MIAYDFDKTIKETLKKHDVNDPNLELALNELFQKFESRILSEKFVKEISIELNRQIERQKRAWGIR